MTALALLSSTGLGSCVVLVLGLAAVLAAVRGGER